MSNDKLKSHGPRFKVWARQSDGGVGLFLGRTGVDPNASDFGARDFTVEDDRATPGHAAALACKRNNFFGDVIVKNFDTGVWFIVTVGLDWAVVSVRTLDTPKLDTFGKIVGNEEALKKIDEMIQPMADEQRSELFAEMNLRWCRHCGRKQPADYAVYGGCQCWNDE